MIGGSPEGVPLHSIKAGTVRGQCVDLLCNIDGIRWIEQDAVLVLLHDPAYLGQVGRGDGEAPHHVLEELVRGRIVVVQTGRLVRDDTDVEAPEGRDEFGHRHTGQQGRLWRTVNRVRRSGDRLRDVHWGRDHAAQEQARAIEVS